MPKKMLVTPYTFETKKLLGLPWSYRLYFEQTQILEFLAGPAATKESMEEMVKLLNDAYMLGHTTGYTAGYNSSTIVDSGTKTIDASGAKRDAYDFTIG